MSDSPISLRAYAKRRGCSAMSVSVAVRDGRLSRSVVRDEHGQPKIGDPDLADREWEANTDPVKRANAAGGVNVPPRYAPPAPPVEELEADAPVKQFDDEGAETIGSATQRLKAAQADLAELKFRTEAGGLVPAHDVEMRLVTVFTACKTRLLAIPSRARQALPHLVAADLGVLESLIREALEDLAEAK